MIRIGNGEGRSPTSSFVAYELHDPLTPGVTDLGRSSSHGALPPTPDPSILWLAKVFVEDDEVYRTKVAPMTLSPAWNETFAISRGASGDYSRSDDVPWGIRFEIWDHNTVRSGCCLGEFRERERGVLLQGMKGVPIPLAWVGARIVVKPTMYWDSFS